MGWVQAKWEATPSRMFRRLRDAVRADFDEFKALTGDGQLRRDQFDWEVSESGDIFCIVDKGDAAIHESVRFCLDRAEGIIAIEWWKLVLGNGRMENRWLSRPTPDGGLGVEVRRRSGEQGRNQAVQGDAGGAESQMLTELLRGMGVTCGCGDERSQGSAGRRYR